MRYQPCLFLLCAAMMLLPVSTVQACSGGPPPWDVWLPQLMNDSDVVVTGQYTMLDDAQGNGIFQVSSYAQGQGPEYLVIQVQDVRLIENEQHINRFYSTCSRQSRIKDSGSYVYFLTRHIAGHYELVHGRYFADDSATINTSYAPRDSRPITRSQLLDQIQAISGVSATLPDTDALYPRQAPVLLQTASSAYFLLPIDRNTPLAISSEQAQALRRDRTACQTPPCVVYSPSGVDKIYLYRPEDDRKRLDWTLPYVESNAIGERVMVSPTGDTYAVWHNQQIQIFALWYPRLGYPENSLARIYYPEQVNLISVGNSLSYPAVWLPDGRMLLFSTDAGLWLWDALTENSEPQLIRPAAGTVPQVRYVSPQGRYIAVREGDDYYTLDRVSGRELPDGYVSPDDRILLVFDTQSETPTSLEIMYLAPGIRRIDYYSDVRYQDVQWMDNEMFVASITGDQYLTYRPEKLPEPDPMTGAEYEAIPVVVNEIFFDVVRYPVAGIERSVQQVPYGIDIFQMNDFTYSPEPVHGLIAISVYGQHIRINGDVINLSVLSSPIEDAIWLPSVLYMESGR